MGLGRRWMMWNSTKRFPDVHGEQPFCSSSLSPAVAVFALLLLIIGAHSILITRRTVKWKHSAPFVCLCIYGCCLKACLVPIRESIVLLRDARGVMCRLAWLNWIMLNLYALWECLRWRKVVGGRVMKWGCKGLMHSEWAEKVCVCMCLSWEGAGLPCFLTLSSAGPPVNVAMAIEVASIDHISEANMVSCIFFLFFFVLRTLCFITSLDWDQSFSVCVSLI